MLTLKCSGSSCRRAPFSQLSAMRLSGNAAILAPNSAVYFSVMRRLVASELRWADWPAALPASAACHGYLGVFRAGQGAKLGTCVPLKRCTKMACCYQRSH